MNTLENPLVNVIIPVWNGEKTILRAVNSIIEQTYLNVEILIVNDASTDNTKTILDSLKEPRVRIINLDKNIGRSAARNLAIDRAKGEYVAMLDADDWSYQDRIKEQVAYINKYNVSLCGTWAYLVDSSGNKSEWRQPTTTEEIRKTILRSNTFIHSTVMAKKTVLEEFGGYNENIKWAEDYDLYLKISSKYPVGNVPIILCEYTAPSGLKYSINEQWNKIKVKWKAIFNYGYSKKNLVYLLTPLIAILIPRRLKVWLKTFLIRKRR